MASINGTPKVAVYLVRHAETLSNMTMGREDREDPTLTELTPYGKKQAIRVGELLSTVNLDHACSSSYRRAIDTAENILKCQNRGGNNSQLEIEISDDIKEIDLGLLSSASYVDTIKSYVKENVPLQDWIAPEGESIKDVGERFLRHFQKTCAHLLNTDQDKNLLIVSHSMAITAFLNYLSYRPHPHSMINWNPETDIKVIKNCCYYKFEVTKSPPLAAKSIEKGSSCSSDSIVLPLNINVIEKHVDSHLKQTTENDDTLRENAWDRRKYVGHANEVRKVMESTEKGREVLNCVQQ